MKRHRILAFDFDTRVHTLDPIPDTSDEHVKEQHRANKARTIAGLKQEFGEGNFDQKLQNFRDLGAKALSIVAFHNRFYQQSRAAFVQCQYYPALTGVAALGERVLNHLVLRLRDSYKTSDAYKHIHRKDSFDNWRQALDALNEWGILTPQADTAYRELWQLRNNAVHFNPGAEENDRGLALEALRVFDRIISAQFAAFGDLPWIFIHPGEIYVRRDWEQHPFIQLVYLQNTLRVGYKHRVVSAFPWHIEDVDDYEERAISDEEYSALRHEFQRAG